MLPHSRLRRFVSFALVVLVLITSVGFTVQRTTCRSSGRSRVAVSVAAPGALRGNTAGRGTATTKLRNGCCDFSEQLHKLSHPAHELAAKILMPTPLLAVLPQPGSRPGTSVAAQLVAGRGRWYAPESSPPPPGGRALLALGCTLVV